MKQLFILNKAEAYTEKDPNWRSIGTLDEYDRYPKVYTPEVQVDIVTDSTIRIPLLRKQYE